MTRLCIAYEGYACDMSLEGEHSRKKRCDPCAKQHTLIMNRRAQREVRKASKHTRDTFTLEGAMRLKSEIEGRWEAKGHRVTCELVKGPYNNCWRRAPYFLRSDLINGLPPKLNQQIGA